jgi:hypothetical protein
MSIHLDTNILHCHYFNNDKNCPFQEHGCKFLHQETKICTFRQKCQRRLCPFRHVNKKLHAESEVKESINEKHDIDLEENETSDEEIMSSEFVLTSTPKKVDFDCDECVENEQCTDCFVSQLEATGQIPRGVHKKKKMRVHF